MLKLSIQDNEGRATYVPLADGELSIGRDEANSICLSDRNVSRQHARLLTRNGHVFVENIQATYGTRFNNLLLRERAEVVEGDVLQVGDYVLELVSDEHQKRDNALLDTEATPSAPTPTKARPDNATAVVNLADLAAGLKGEAPGNAVAIPESAQPRLIVESENMRGLELRVTRTQVVIGRVRESADLVIDHRSISKEHARLTRQSDGTWQILDLGSANGLKINGEPYSKCEVSSGDRIELGHVSMRFLSAGARAPVLSASDATPKTKPPLGLILALAGLVVLIAGAGLLYLVTRGPKAETAPATPSEVGAIAPEAAPTLHEPPAAAEPEADHGPTPEEALRQADKLAQGGMLDDALAVLKEAQSKHAGNAPLGAAAKQIEQEIAWKQTLAEADKKSADDPQGAAATASEIRAKLKEGSSLIEMADAIVAKGKAPAKPKKEPEAAPRVVVKAEPKPEPKAVVHEHPKAAPPAPAPAPKPEIKPPPPPAPAPAPAAAEVKKSGADLYKDGRDAMLAGRSEDAVNLFKQAVKAGNGKGYGQLARIYFQKGDKAQCAQAAKSYLDRYPDAGDAQPIQSLLEKCSN